MVRKSCSSYDGAQGVSNGRLNRSSDLLGPHVRPRRVAAGDFFDAGSRAVFALRSFAGGRPRSSKSLVPAIPLIVANGAL